MTNTHRRLLFCLAIGALLPLSIVQAAPAPVGGIAATYENGSLNVTWNAPANTTDVSYYRIYYSRSSILQNNGDFDDFERTTGNLTAYTFPAVPYTDTTLYLAVLAVDAAGAESETFTEETSIMIPAAQPVPSASSSSVDTLPIPTLPTDVGGSSSSQDTTQIPFLMTHALTMSPTEIGVYFTKELSPQSTVNSGTVIVTNASGARLQILGVSLNGTSVIVTTAPQNSEDMYTIPTVGTMIAMDGTALIPSGTPVMFRGHPVMPSSTSSTPPVQQPEQDTTAPGDPSDLLLQSKLLSNGKYDVRAQWQEGAANNANDLDSYVVSATLDGQGQGLQSVNAADKGIAYGDVQPGLFRMIVQAKDKAGNVSSGIAKEILLPQTGVGLLGAMAIAGALAGRRTVKRKSERKS